MHWVVQNNLFNEEANQQLVELLERFEIPHTLVKVIPFGGGIEPDLEFDENEKVVVIGSVSLVKHAQNKGWKPGAWLNEKFDYDHQIDVLSYNMLNWDAEVSEFKYVPAWFGKHSNSYSFDTGRRFIRPVLDGKEFAGKVFTYDEFIEWFIMIAKGDSMWTVNMNTMVLTAPVKEILAEYRFIIVKGKIITASQYKRGSTVFYGTEIPEKAYEYAKVMVDNWQLADVYVMDVAHVLAETYPLSAIYPPPVGLKETYRIIEFNNFNSAGWYKCDVSKIVQAIETMDE